MRKLQLLTLCIGASLLVLSAAASAKDFIAAPLSGGEEVPANASKARGNALFEVSADGLSINYKLIVANIDNVVFAHIHCCAPVGTNAGVVTFLAGPFAPGGGTSNGVLATGTITAANLIGSLAGHPLSDLIDAMQAGTTYVNVHTNDGVSPPNTGPGDIPGGEIRAQIRPN
jgi:CHRD domain-containing protein